MGMRSRYRTMTREEIEDVILNYIKKKVKFCTSPVRIAEALDLGRDTTIRYIKKLYKDEKIYTMRFGQYTLVFPYARSKDFKKSLKKIEQEEINGTAKKRIENKEDNQENGRITSDGIK